jgi:MFS transporter, PPP family, 3-phenylpropionic acid transporter
MSLVAVIQLPFWPVWLAARGLTAGEIGIVLADAICLKVLARPAIGTISGRAGKCLGGGLVMAAAGALYST